MDVTKLYTVDLFGVQDTFPCALSSKRGQHAFAPFAFGLQGQLPVPLRVLLGAGAHE